MQILFVSFLLSRNRLFDNCLFYVMIFWDFVYIFTLYDNHDNFCLGKNGLQKMSGIVDKFCHFVAEINLRLLIGI